MGGIEEKRYNTTEQAKENACLFKLMGETDDVLEKKEIREKIILLNAPLVKALLWRWLKCDNSRSRIRGIHSLKDFENEGMIGLIKAVDTFDITKNAQFSTYAYHMIRCEFHTCYNKLIFIYTRAEMRKTSVEQGRETTRVEQESAMTDSELIALREVKDTNQKDMLSLLIEYETPKVETMIKQVDERQSMLRYRVFKEYYMPEKNKANETLRTLGGKYNVSHEAIRLWLNECIYDLRKLNMIKV